MAQLLTACPAVDDVEEQPLTIWYTWQESGSDIALLDSKPSPEFRKAHRCSYIVPDFLVTMNGGQKRLVEVKPSHRLTNPEVQRKLLVARRYAEEQDWTFHVMTERELFAGSLLANVRLVTRFRGHLANLKITSAIEELVSQQPITLGELRGKAVDAVAARWWIATALHLVAIHQLTIDLTAAPISNTTLLHPAGVYAWDPFDSAWGPSGSVTNGHSASRANSAPRNSS